MKRSEKTIGPYLILFTIVLSWNGIWWFLLTPEGYPAVQAHSGFTVQYFPFSNAQGSVGLDPAIFSLPSRVGFSRAALSSKDSILPPLEFEKSLSIFMNQPEDRAVHSMNLDVESFDRTLIQRIKRGPSGGQIQREHDFEKKNPEQTTAWHLEGLEFEASSLATWVRELSSLTNAAWSIKLSFDTDPLGYVEHVFIERSTDIAGLDHKLRSAMGALHFAPKSESGRLWIKHLGSAEGEE